MLEYFYSGEIDKSIFLNNFFKIKFLKKQLKNIPKIYFLLHINTK